jgi:hypothetical protein
MWNIGPGWHYKGCEPLSETGEKLERAGMLRRRENSAPESLDSYVAGWQNDLEVRKGKCCGNYLMGGSSQGYDRPPGATRRGKEGYRNFRKYEGAEGMEVVIGLEKSVRR